ncbi:MAG: Holliday junction resolvase RuvX [Candidatus Tectomicrobia bacterium]|nr:Holliday junction resolvase RuvX [Candidatus Tectomicrobia bacterium]
MSRVLGLDIGEATIGVAVSDALGLTAQGLETIKRKELKSDFERLQELIEEYDVGEIVVGLPKNMNGTIGSQAEKMLHFAERLREIFRLPVFTWDERLTTMEAEKFLIAADVRRKRRRQVINTLAAQLILQGYLDRKNLQLTGSPPGEV